MGFIQAPHIPGRKGTSFHSSLCSGSLAQQDNRSPRMAPLSSLDGEPRGPENELGRPHHKPRRLSPPTRSLTGAYPLLIEGKISITGLYSKRGTKPSAGHLRKCSPCHLPGSLRPLTGPLQEVVPCVGQLKPELPSECGGRERPAGGLGVLSRVGAKGGNYTSQDALRGAGSRQPSFA